MEHIGSKGEPGPQGQGPLCQRAAATHERCASLLRSGLGDVQEAWLWTSREVDELLSQLRALVGAEKGRGPGTAVVIGRSNTGASKPERLGSERCLFFMGLAGGWGWERSLCDLGDIGSGTFIVDGVGFQP